MIITNTFGLMRVIMTVLTGGCKDADLRNAVVDLLVLSRATRAAADGFPPQRRLIFQGAVARWHCLPITFVCLPPTIARRRV